VSVSGGVRDVRRTMIPPSSSSVRTGPSAVRTSVGPRQRSQPLCSYSPWTPVLSAPSSNSAPMWSAAASSSRVAILRPRYAGCVATAST
jgi:hypothetical protein